MKFECREKALHHGVVPTAVLWGHAAADLVLAEKRETVAGSVLAALIRVNEQLLGLHMPLAEGSVEELEHLHLRAIYPLIKLPADHKESEKIDPDRQVPPARCGTDLGDIARRAAITGRGLKVLLH